MMFPVNTAAAGVEDHSTGLDKKCKIGKIISKRHWFSTSIVEKLYTFGESPSSTARIFSVVASPPLFLLLWQRFLLANGACWHERTPKEKKE